MGIVLLGEKLEYLGARAGATAAYSVLLALGFDPLMTTGVKILGKVNPYWWEGKSITLYGPQISLGLGKMPNGSIMCGRGPDAKGLLCQAQLGSGVGIGLTFGYSKRVDM